MTSTAGTDTALQASGTFALVGVLLAGLWWACGRCRRCLMLETRLRADRESVYQFLSDPRNLKVIHPFTKDVKIQQQEEGPVHSAVDFVWVEETCLCLTLESLMSMTRNYEARSLCICNKHNSVTVRLDWVLKEDPRLTTTSAHGDSSDIISCEGTTVFRNTISVSGPRFIVLVFWLSISSSEKQLMRNVQKLFSSG